MQSQQLAGPNVHIALERFSMLHLDLMALSVQNWLYRAFSAYIAVKKLKLISWKMYQQTIQQLKIIHKPKQ